MQAIFGVQPFSGGTMKVWRKTVTSGSLHKAMENKIAMLAANRKENSILSEMTLLENTYIAEHCLSAQRPLIHKRYEVEKYQQFASMLGIKAKSHNETIVTLSGGNQQKVILGRWLNTNVIFCCWIIQHNGDSRNTENRRLVCGFLSRRDTTLQIPIVVWILIAQWPF